MPAFVLTDRAVIVQNVQPTEAIKERQGVGRVVIAADDPKPSSPNEVSPSLTSSPSPSLTPATTTSQVKTNMAASSINWRRLSAALLIGIGLALTVWGLLIATKPTMEKTARF